MRYSLALLTLLLWGCARFASAQDQPQARSSDRNVPPECTRIAPPDRSYSFDQQELDAYRVGYSAGCAAALHQHSSANVDDALQGSRDVLSFKAENDKLLASLTAYCKPLAKAASQYQGSDYEKLLFKISLLTQALQNPSVCRASAGGAQ